jgi:hypothetical protein
MKVKEKNLQLLLIKTKSNSNYLINYEITKKQTNKTKPAKASQNISFCFHKK